jgi:hypothetical protein
MVIYLRMGERLNYEDWSQIGTYNDFSFVDPFAIASRNPFDIPKWFYSNIRERMAKCVELKMDGNFIKSIKCELPQFMVSKNVSETDCKNSQRYAMFVADHDKMQLPILHPIPKHTINIWDQHMPVADIQPDQSGLNITVELLSKVCTCSLCNNKPLFVSDYHAFQTIDITETPDTSYFRIKISENALLKLPFLFAQTIPMSFCVNYMDADYYSHEEKKNLYDALQIIENEIPDNVKNWKIFIGHANGEFYANDEEYLLKFRTDHANNVIVCIHGHKKPVSLMISLTDLMHAFRGSAPYSMIYNQQYMIRKSKKGKILKHTPFFQTITELNAQTYRVADIIKNIKIFPPDVKHIICEYLGDQWVGPLKNSSFRYLLNSDVVDRPNILNIISEFAFTPAPSNHST